MGDDGVNCDGTITTLRSPSRHRRKIKEEGDSSHDIDSISSLPDEILQSILSFLETRFAITTSVLSKRWYRVWSGTPSLSFNWYRATLKADLINETLARYKAPKMTSIHLCASFEDHLPCIDRWIEFAMSRNVDNIWLKFNSYIPKKYKIPDFFYVNSSLKQLSLEFLYAHIKISGFSVSWTSLKKLSLTRCELPDKCMAKILSGCPILESLTLYHCENLKVLDLSGLLSLRTLEIYGNSLVSGPRQIIAPHLRCLRLKDYSGLPCTLVDVSSLTEAALDIGFHSLKAAFQDMVLDMLEKLKNVEKFTFGSNFLQILSFAELRGVPFPRFKVKYLTLETRVLRNVIPGLVRVLQNSPGLKKLTLLTTDYSSIPEKSLDKYFNLDQCRSSGAREFENISRWNPEPKYVAWFMELMLKATKSLEKMVVKLEDYLVGIRFNEFLDMVPTLSYKRNVSIVIMPNQRANII